jgi:hypothetical protein
MALAGMGMPNFGSSYSRNQEMQVTNKMMETGRPKMAEMEAMPKMKMMETDVKQADQGRSMSVPKLPYSQMTPPAPMTAQQAEEDKMRKLEEAWDKQAAAWAAQGLKPPPKGPAKQANGVSLTPEQKAQEMVWEKQRAEWAAVQAKLQMNNSSSGMGVSRNNGYGTMTVGEASAKMAAAGEKARQNREAQAQGYVNSGRGSVSRNNGYGTMSAKDASAKMASAEQKFMDAEKKLTGVLGVSHMNNSMFARPKPVDLRPIITALSTINTTLLNSLTLIESTAKKNDINPELSEMNDYLLEIVSNFPGQGGGGKTPSKKGTPKKKGKSAKDTKAKSGKDTKGKSQEVKNKKSDESSATADPDINQVVQGLNTINTTLASTLAAIANRLKATGVTSELERTNRYLSEINDMLAEQYSSSSGGGMRRLHVKKGNKTRRKSRT